MVLLDTHIWLWWLLGDGNLSESERESLNRQALEGNLFISWVTIWETEMLERKGRIVVLPDLVKWISKATQPEICRILPADVNVVLKQRKLPEDFHADPADRLITATAMLAECPLATRDRRIIQSDVCEIWSELK